MTNDTRLYENSGSESGTGENLMTVFNYKILSRCHCSNSNINKKSWYFDTAASLRAGIFVATLSAGQVLVFSCMSQV